MARMIKPSTGRVFRDLDLPAAEAPRLLIRADLLIEIQRIAKSRRLSSAALGRLLRVSHRRLDDLRQGRVRRLRTDTPIDLLSRPGVDARLLQRTIRHPGSDHLARAKALRCLRLVLDLIPSDVCFKREGLNQR